METRPYFVAGDVLVNAGAGALVGAVCALLFDGDWPMPLGMVAGMLVGMLVAMPVAMAGSIAFGALEVLLPVMTTGMVVGMLAATRVAPVDRASAGGALAGIGVLALTYLLNAWVARRGTSWTR